MAKINMLDYFIGEEEEKQAMFTSFKEFLYKVNPYSIVEKEEVALSFINDAFNTAKGMYVSMGFMTGAVATDTIIIGKHETEIGKIDFYNE